MTNRISLQDLMRSTSKPVELDQRGACRTTNPIIFDGESIEDINQAKLICAECPVAALCLEWAVPNEGYGVWAGTTPRQRTKLRNGAKLITPEEILLENERIVDLRGSMTPAELAIKYGKDQRTIFRWKAELEAMEIAS